MTSVKTAKKLIIENITLQEPENTKLSVSLSRILAENIIAPINHPLFNQSSVDGYAFKHRDLKNNISKEPILNLIGEIKAGDTPSFRIKKNEAVRIFTGAALPLGADTIIMQEFVNKKNSLIYLNKIPQLGSSVRFKGGQLKKGDVALQKGTSLNPASIGFLASLGISKVMVYTKPTVGIVVTGSEFLKTNNIIKIGKIFESNGLMLQKALEKLSIKAQYKICEDDEKKLFRTTKTVTGNSQITIITGGVSVGDYDYTKNILAELGFRIIFHNVNQKPGKPLLFAKKDDKTVFGLPGNPRSVLVCYYEYVYPYIRASMGSMSPFLTKIQLPLAYDFKKKYERSSFLSAEAGNRGVKIKQGQESHMLKSFSDTNIIIYLPEGIREYKAGEMVEIHLI